MNEQAISDAYALFKQRGYNDSIDDFKNLINTNPDALQDAYSIFAENGYSDKIEDFKTLMGVGATIKPEVAQPGELAGPITQPKPLSPQEIQQLKIKEQPQVIEELKPFLTDENKNIIDIPQYTPSSVEDEMFKLESLRKIDEKQKGVLPALKTDASRKAVLVQQFINQKQKEAQENVNLYAQSRVKYYQSVSKTEQDLKLNNEKLTKEVEAYAKTQDDIINSEIKPYYEEFAKAVNNPILAQARDKETGAEFERGLQQGSLSLKNMFGKPEFTSEPYQPDSYIEKIISPFRSFAKSFQSTLADQIPAELYSFRSSTISGVSFDDALARAYKAKNRIIPPRGGASPDWENRIKAQAIQERIDEIGQEGYDKEKADYDKKQVDQKLKLDKESAREKGEAAARMYGIPSSFEEAKQKGILGLGQFTGSMMGQVTGFAAPGMVASAFTGGTAIPAAVSIGTMAVVEKGSAYSEGVELLREKYPDLTKEQIYAKNLDAEVRDASTRTGLTNAALEYVGQLSVFGRFIPKNKVAQLFDKLVDKMPAKGLSRVTIGTLGEGLTEWIQRKDTRINNYMAVDGLSFGEAVDKAMEQDDSEDFIGGAIGGGGMSLIGESASAVNRKVARLPYQRAGYTSAQLDLLSKNPENYTVSAKTETGKRYIFDKQGGLVIPETKKAEFTKTQIDADINQTASTGNAGIDSEIDNQANEIINDQERKVGVSGGIQQGETAVQKGAQPEVSGAQTEAGGVLQVSPETPGKTEVTAQPTPEITNPEITKPEVTKPITDAKADIERRRQEDLDNSIIFLINDGTYGGSKDFSLREYLDISEKENSKQFAIANWKYINVNGTGVFINRDGGQIYIVPNNTYNKNKPRIVKLFFNKGTKRIDISNPNINIPNLKNQASSDGVNYDSLLKEVESVIISADAELAALEGKQPTAPEVTAPKTTPTAPEVTTPETTAQPAALLDVESTTKALEGKDITNISRDLGIDANWDMIGESDALAGNDAVLAYTQRQLPAWNRASQRGEIDPNSELTYDIVRGTLGGLDNKEVVEAKDQKGIVVGVVKLDNKGGIQHIAVAPEFRGKGVANKLVEKLKEYNPNLDLSKTKLRSKGFEKAFAKRIIAEAYQKAKADGSNPQLVQAVEQLIGAKPDVTAQPEVEQKIETQTVTEIQKTEEQKSDKLKVVETNLDEIVQKVIANQTVNESEISDAVASVQQALQSTGIKVVRIDNIDEYNTKLASIGETRETDGVFAAEDGTIYLNGYKLNNGIEAGRVVFHEAAHPVINIIRNTNKQLYDKLVKGLRSSNNPQIKDAINWIKQNYTGDVAINDEAIVEVIAMVADGTLDVNDLNPGLRQTLIDIINYIAKMLGLGQIKDTDSKVFIDTVNNIANALTEGIDISKIVGKENVLDFFNNIEAPSSVIGSIDGSNTTQARISDKPAVELYESKQVSKLPILSIDEIYQKYNGNIVVINSDPTRVGELKLLSGKTIFMYGGPGYLSIKDNVDGNVGFATTQLSKVKTWSKYIKEQFGNKKGVTLVGTQAPFSLLGNSYALRYVMDAISQLPKSVLKSSEFKSEFFGKDLVALKNAFGAEGYKEFVNKYSKADLSDEKVIDSMIAEMAYKVGDDNKPASFKARSAFLGNLLGGIDLKDNRVATKGQPGYVSVTPKKFIATELFKRFGLNQEKLFYELGEKSIVDLFMSEGKWGLAVSGFETDPKLTIESVQSKGIKHPLFNAKFPGKNSFLLDGAYELNSLLTPVEMMSKKGNPYTKTAAQMLAGSMYVKGQKVEGEKAFEFKSKPYSTLGISSERTQARVSKPIEGTNRLALARAISKIGETYIEEGKATVADVFDKLKIYMSDKYNIDISDMEQEIMGPLVAKENKPVFDAQTAVVDFYNDPTSSLELWSYGEVKDEEKAKRKATIESMAGYLAGIVDSKEQVQEFVDAFNTQYPNRAIDPKDASKVWSKLKVKEVKPATVTQKITKIIQDKWRARAKGQTIGIKNTTEKFRELIKYIQDAIKDNNFTYAQEKAILNKLRSVNLFTAGSVSKLKVFIDKAINDAAYADKLFLVAKLKKQLKNPPKSIPPNIKKIAKDLAYIDPYDDMLDEYIAYASMVRYNFLRPDNERYTGVNESAVETFIQMYYRRKEAEDIAILMKSASDNEITLNDLENADNYNNPEETTDITNIESLVQSDKVNETKEKLKEIAFLLQPLLEDVEVTGILNNQLLTSLRNFNINNANISYLVTFIRIANNAISNGNLSGAGALSAMINAQKNVNSAVATVKKYNKYYVDISKINTAWYGITGSLQNIYEKITKSEKGLDALMDYLGVASYDETSSQAAQVFNNTERNVDNKVSALNKQYKTNLLDQKEQVKFSVLGELAKHVNDPTANISKVVKNIEADIKELLASRSKESIKLAKQLYDVLNDIYNKGAITATRKADPAFNNYQFSDGEVIGSAYTVINYFDKNQKPVYELWDFFTKNVFTKGLFDQSEQINALYYNGSLLEYKYYMPTTHRKIGEGVVDEDVHRNTTLNPQQNKRLKEASRSRRSGYTYSYVQSISDALNAYRQVLHDNYTTPAQFQFKEAIARPELVDESGIMSGDTRDLLIRDYRRRTDINRSLMFDSLESAQLILDSLTRNIKNIVNITRLFSLRQVASQFVPAYASLVFKLGNNAKFLHVTTPKEFDDVIKMVPLGESNLEEGILNLNNQLNVSDKALQNTLFGALEKSKKFTNKLAVKTLGPVIQKPDFNIRKRGWTAFYIGKLIEQGVAQKDIDLATERDKQDQEERIKARRHATNMMSKLMAPSTKFSKAELWKQKGVLNATINTYLPFGTFTVNFKNRIVTGMDKIYYGNVAEGIEDITSATAEATTWSAIQVLWAIYIANPLASVIFSYLFGYEPPEEYEDTTWGWSIKQWQDFWTKVYLDLNPIAISLGENFMLNTTNFIVWLNSDTNLNFSEWKDSNEKKDKSFLRKKTYEQTGYFGIAGDDLLKTWESGRNYYNSIDYKGPYIIPNEMFKDTELRMTPSLKKIAEWDLIMNSLGTLAPGEVKSAWRSVKRKAERKAREKQKD